MSTPSTTSPSQPAGIPSVEMRTVVSFLIFVHLFALTAALVFTPGMSSDLEQRVVNLPVLRQYRQALDMNLPYTYHLTFGGEDFDFEHQLEVDLELPDGQRKLVILPGPGLWPRSRHNRYQMLAFNTAAGIGQENIETILPQGITYGLLDQYGATRANFRCRVHLGLGRDRIIAKADPQAPETWRTVYEAAIWKTPDGQIRLLKQESARDSAPGAAPTGSSNGAQTNWTPPPLNGEPTLPAATPSPGAAAPTNATPETPTSGRSGLNRAPLTFPSSR